MTGPADKKQSNRIYIVLLAASVCLAFAVLVLTKGRLDFSLLGKTLTHPADTEENLAYGLLYHPSSERILERDGIILKNLGSEIIAEDLTSRISFSATNIRERSSRPILQFSEYVGYFYLYDGETVYRTNVDGSQLKAAVKDCLKFEPMGTYLYSLKMVHGTKRLFRCSIIGTYEKMLFKDEILDFWAYGGHLLTLTPDGEYQYYSVLTENTYTHRLPDDAAHISLDELGILYLSVGGDGYTHLYRRPYLSGEDTLAVPLPVTGYAAGENHIALLLPSGPEEGSRQAAWCQSDGSTLQIFKNAVFSSGCALDISARHLFVTKEDGTVSYTPLSHEEWNDLFEDSQ